MGSQDVLLPNGELEMKATLRTILVAAAFVAAAFAGCNSGVGRAITSSAGRVRDWVGDKVNGGSSGGATEAAVPSGGYGLAPENQLRLRRGMQRLSEFYRRVASGDHQAALGMGTPRFGQDTPPQRLAALQSEFNRFNGAKTTSLGYWFESGDSLNLVCVLALPSGERALAAAHLRGESLERFEWRSEQ